jgi:hypothetical protein
LLIGSNGTRPKAPPNPLSDPVTRAPVKALPVTVTVELMGCEDCSAVTWLNCQLLMK